MQPDSNQHPRFQWKPDEPAGLSQPENISLSNGLRFPKAPDIASLRLRKEAYDVSEIRCEGLSDEQILSTLDALGFSVPPDFVEHLILLAGKGGPIDLETYGACAPVMQDIEVVHWVSHVFGDGDPSSSWTYTLTKYVDEEEGQDVLLSPLDNRELYVRFRKGSTPGWPQLVIDWNESLCTSDELVRERWNVVHQILSRIEPNLGIEGIGSLSEFVDDEASKHEYGIVLKLGAANVLVYKHFKPESKRSESSSGDPGSAVGVSTGGEDFHEETVPIAYKTASNVERDEEEHQAKVRPAKPRPGEPIRVRRPSAKNLAKLSSLAGLDLNTRFFTQVLDLMEREAEPEPRMFNVLLKVGREVSFSKDTSYDTDDMGPGKWSDITIEDTSGPYGMLLVNLKHTWSEELDRRVVEATLEFNSSPDELKDVPWKKLIKLAGY